MCSHFKAPHWQFPYCSPVLSFAPNHVLQAYKQAKEQGRLLLTELHVALIPLCLIFSFKGPHPVVKPANEESIVGSWTCLQYIMAPWRGQLKL